MTADALDVAFYRFLTLNDDTRSNFTDQKIDGSNIPQSLH